MMQRTSHCSSAPAGQETATKEPRKVEFEAVVNEEGGRAAFSWTEGEDVTEKATAYCKENTKGSSGSGALVRSSSRSRRR